MIAMNKLHHLSEGAVRLRFTSGTRLPCKLLLNDSQNKRLHCEIGEGNFACFGYSELAYATRCLIQPEAFTRN